MRTVTLAAVVVTAGMAHAGSDCTLDPLWTLEGFADPESAAIDLEREVIYVSNAQPPIQSGKVGP